MAELMAMETNNFPVMIAAGGTGGHVFPALAVCEELVSRGISVLWIGTSRGIESRVAMPNGVTLELIEVRGFRGKSMLQKFLVPFGLLKAIVRVRSVMKKSGVRVVLGFGGYVAASAGLAAAISRTPLLIQEQNAVPGSTNRLLSRFARQLFTAFPSAFPGHRRLTLTGNPVRRQICERAASIEDQDRQDGTFRLVILGGSLGAKPINDLVPAALSVLEERVFAATNISGMTAKSSGVSDVGRLHVAHQTGPGHLQSVKDGYRDASFSGSNRVDVALEEFFDDMQELLATADLVIARAGALTVSELAVMGVPSILIPLPHAIDNHQYFNAQFMESEGAAILLQQDGLDVEKLVAVLETLLRDSRALQTMAKRAKAVARPEASQTIAMSCMEYVA